MMKRFGVLTSGGDAPGMNACIRAVARTAYFYGMEVLGIERGYDGLIEGAISPLGPRDVSDTIQRGGTFLKTARSEMFMTDEGFERALAMMENFGMEGLVVIGGNGSLTGALRLMKAGAKVIGLPGTIDNDLAYTDFTIGFDTAVNTALLAIGNIRDTSSAHERITIIEVMGRECGDLALYAGITGGAEIILTPEHPVDITEICRSLIEYKNKGKTSSIIIKAEGVQTGTIELEEEIIRRTGLDVKSVVLGYIQRGGAPSAADRMYASRFGSKAVELLRDGISGKAVGIKDGEIIATDLAEALSAKRPSEKPLFDLATILSS